MDLKSGKSITNRRVTCWSGSNQAHTLFSLYFVTAGLLLPPCDTVGADHHHQSLPRSICTCLCVTAVSARVPGRSRTPELEPDSTHTEREREGDREKKNNNSTLLLIDCLAQERRRRGSFNPANSSHDSDTFSKVNSLLKCDNPGSLRHRTASHRRLSCSFRHTGVEVSEWSVLKSTETKSELPYSQYQVKCRQLPA